MERADKPNEPGYALGGALIALLATKRRRQPKPDDGQRFLEAFAHTLGGAGMIGLEPTSQVLQESLADGDVLAAIRALQDRLDPRALTLREVVEDIPELVDLTALYERRVTEGVRPACVPAKAASEDQSALKEFRRARVDRLSRSRPRG